MRRSPTAFTVFEFLIVLAMAGLIVVFVLPYIARGTAHVARIKCVNNLKNTALAFRIFAVDNSDHFPFELSVTNGGTLEIRTNLVSHFQILSNELSTPKIIVCPERVSPMTAATSWVTLHRTNIGYFVGLSASENSPNSILLGDAGLAVDAIAISNATVRVSTNELIRYPTNVHELGRPTAIAVSDGSVIRASSSNWTKFLPAAPNGTNLFLVP